MTLPLIPGDAKSLASRASSLQDAAALIEKAARDLAALADETKFKSDAVGSVRDNATDIVSAITKAQVRYKGTADALAVYAPRLDSAQARAATASAAYTRADHTWSAANSNVTTYKFHLLDPLLSDHDRLDYTKRLAQARSERAAADAARTHARGDYDGAVADAKAAAVEAGGLIDVAIEQSDLNDSIWDDLKKLWGDIVASMKEYVSPIIAAIRDMIKEVSPILGIITLVCAVLACIPVIGAPFAVLAGALAIVGLGLALLDVVASGYQLAMGETTLGDFVGAVIGATVAVVLAGVGAAFKAPAEAAAKAAVKAGLKPALTSEGIVEEAVAGKILQLVGKDGAGFATRIGNALGAEINYVSDRSVDRIADTTGDVVDAVGVSGGIPVGVSGAAMMMNASVHSARVTPINTDLVSVDLGVAYSGVLAPGALSGAVAAQVQTAVSSSGPVQCTVASFSGVAA